MIGWAGTNYAARLDLEENSITRVKNVHIFNDVDDDVDIPCVDVVDDASNWMDFCLVLLVELQIDVGSMLELIASLCERWC